MRWLAPAVVVLALAVAVAIVSVAGGDDKSSTPPSRRAGKAPVRVRTGPPRRAPVPVLMYHDVDPAPAGGAYVGLYVPPEAFAAEMAALDRKGYRGVTLRQVEDAWQRGTPLPRKPVVVSFDDGYLGQLRHAAPVLRRLHWPGVLSLEEGAFKDPNGLSPKQVAELIRQGWELASHTINHRDLRTLDPKQLRYEIDYSRAVYRRMFHVPVENFTYPAGFYNPQVVRVVRAAGYRGALTVEPGLASRDEPFELKRIRISGPTSGDALLQRLSGFGA